MRIEKKIWKKSNLRDSRRFSSSQVSTGIWIGATPAFQQRVAQREHLATEIAFLEGALHLHLQEKTTGGGGGGWEVRR